MVDKMTMANMETTMQLHALRADTTGFMMKDVAGTPLRRGELRGRRGEVVRGWSSMARVVRGHSLGLTEVRNKEGGSGFPLMELDAEVMRRYRVGRVESCLVFKTVVSLRVVDNCHLRLSRGLFDWTD